MKVLRDVPNLNWGFPKWHVYVDVMLGQKELGTVTEQRLRGHDRKVPTVLWNYPVYVGDRDFQGYTRVLVVIFEHQLS